jgi:hypothetical protein
MALRRKRFVIVILTILVAVVAYFTWRISVAMWRLNNMFGVVMDAIFKISARTDMGVDEIRKTLESVPQTFIREFGIDAYKHVTGQA